MWRSTSPPVTHSNHTSNTQRAQLLLAVSPQAPDHFRSPYVPLAPGKESKRPKPKFHYEDLKQIGEDLASVRPKLYFDLAKGQESVRKSKLPYYRAYRNRKEKASFGISEGMCAAQASYRSSEIHRSTSKPLNKSPTLSSRRKHSAASFSSNPFEPTINFSSADSYGRLPGVPSIRLRILPKRIAKGESESLNSSMELDQFDLRQSHRLRLPLL